MTPRDLGSSSPMGGGPDAFAHFSAIAMEGFKSLKEGSRVTFELSDGPKGPMAINIQSDTGAEATSPNQEN